jgi:hypothetical protein
MNGLDAFFEAARRETKTLPGNLADRILDDALREQERWQAGPMPESRPGFLRQLFDMLGGWPAICGLATACAAGVWIGFSPPQGLEDLVRIDQADSVYFEQENLLLAMAEDG